jgi:phage/plasmid-like protein (TIGR03299 family)
MWDARTDTMARAASAKESWHRGENIVTDDASLDEFAKASKTDFTVSKLPLYVKRGEEFVGLHNSVAIVRDDNNARLGMFTNDYIPVQPAQIRQFFQDHILADQRFLMNTMGAIKGGRLIWALATFRDDNGETLRDIVGSPHEFHALLSTSFDGTQATRGGAVGTRVECRNTLQAAAFEDSVISIRHNITFDSVAQAEAAKNMAKIAEGFEHYKKFAESLYTIKMSRDSTVEFLRTLVGVKPGDDLNETGKGRTKGIVDRLINSLNVTLGEAGTDGYNAWTALNAVTRYVDHERSAKRTIDGETVDDARLASAQFGSGAALKAKAISMLEAA